ncbi:unnamed protein product [Microthlaspi erraticum]|uniref:DUF674 domain-containing protein n=1 Tax=Microthlaspi erraticum TaxID=1685480 RepID=A0A6D2JFX6_9BRAS|nr:unnamed protein product [Microthlaspi erraticum]CAA7044458.1 unnamed protein product [Microthlaspi erraticum]
MAGTEFSEEPTIRLKLLVDKEKNKVVLAEVGKDFVDVLFSFLILPIGTIVRFLQKHHHNQKSPAAATKIGCFNNLYKSVVDMSNDDFLTEACKHILLYPMHVKVSQCKRLKLNIDDTPILKYYRCPDLGNSQSCSKAYSNFYSLKCVCGKFMKQEIIANEGVREEIFVSDNKSFIISDNMKVGFSSISLALKTIRELGHTDLDKLDEMLVDVGHKEVLALLECLLSSDTPLTDAFLMKRSSCIITKTPNMASLAALQDGGKEEESNEQQLSVTLFVRKQDKKVLYAESGQDFVDLLLIFLAVPLELVWGISGNNIELECIDNLCKSKKSLSSSQATHHSSTMLPLNYSFQAPLLGISRKVSIPWSVTINYQRYDLKLMYPNYDGSGESTIHSSSGLVRRGTTYMISDDLTISAKKLFFNYLHIEEVECRLG